MKRNSCGNCTWYLQCKDFGARPENSPCPNYKNQIEYCLESQRGASRLVLDIMEIVGMKEAVKLANLNKSNGLEYKDLLLKHLRDMVKTNNILSGRVRALTRTVDLMSQQEIDLPY